MESLKADFDLLSSMITNFLFLEDRMGTQCPGDNTGQNWDHSLSLGYVSLGTLKLCLVLFY